MANLTLSFALDDNFWNRAILDKRVTATGIDVNAFVDDRPTARHDAMKAGAYDACEVAYSGFIRDQVLREGYPQLSLPIWGNRGLRHRNIVTRNGSRIETLSDLEGGRVGCVHYGMTRAGRRSVYQPSTGGSSSRSSPMPKRVLIGCGGRKSIPSFTA